MSTQPLGYTGETCKIYRASPGWSLTSSALLLPVAALMLILPSCTLLAMMRRTGRVSPVLLVIVGVALAGTVLAIWFSRRQSVSTYLVLSARGIEYRTPGIYIVTTWENVRELTDPHLAPTLLLEESAARSLGLSLGAGPMADQRIPLAPFNYSPGCELAHDLRRYAPHLFAAHS
jgi:hypothetical protein